MVLILKSTPIVAMQFDLKVFSQNRTSMLVLPTPQSPIMMSLRTSSSFLGCIIQLYMSAFQLKREQLRKEIRRSHNELLRKQIRDSLKGKLQDNTYLLVSDTLEDYIMLTHSQLYDNSINIKQLLSSTIFQELTDQEHMRLVTDIYYLVLEKILPELSLTFKKNKDPYTATLVAFLSEEMDPEELVYWIPFMGDEEKSLMFLNIDGLSFSHQKWVANEILFGILLEEMKWSQEAALAYKSILENSQQLSRKQMVQSIESVHKALQNSTKLQNEELKQVLLSVWSTLIIFCQKVKQNRLSSMITILKYELNGDLKCFLSIDLLSNLIQLSRNDPLLYILQDPGPQKVLNLVLNTKTRDNSSNDLYFNYIFQFLYLNWMARHLADKQYRYSKEFYDVLKQFEGKVQAGPFYEKLLKIVR